MNEMPPLEQFQKLRKDIKTAATILTKTEARFLVDHYYIMQEDRKRAHNQERSMDKDNEPHEIITWLAGNSRLMENELKRVLDGYSETFKVGRWMKSIYGIGPVISAGMLAHIDIKKAPSAGHIWSFAGLNPDKKWEKKTKRPWNAELKVLCWKAGQSFMKLHNDESCFYGKLYEKRKEYEVKRNDSGENKELSAKILTEKNFDKKTEAYKHLTAGHLPPAQIDARARRWAVKIFLSHLQTVWWWDDTGEAPPNPFPISHLGHIHYTSPPNMGMFEGLEEALAKKLKQQP